MENIPPKLPFRFLKWFCKPEYHIDIEGDLLELYESRSKKLGRQKAKWLLLRDILLLFRPEIIRSFASVEKRNHTAMLRHNFILSFRSFMRYKSSFLINLIGMSTGLACVLIIWLWVADELSIDKFHEKDEQLYQVLNNHESQDINTWELTPVPLAGALAEEMAEVAYAVPVNDFFSGETSEVILSHDASHVQAKGWHAGKDFFNVFSYPLTAGDNDNVLVSKNNIVISEELAKKLFNTTDNVVGKTLELKHPLFEEIFQVSGIFESPPSSSTAQFDFLISIDVLLDHDRWAKEWTGSYAATYLVLREGTDIAQFNDKIGDYLKAKNPRLDEFTLFVQQYSARYLHGHYENGAVAGGRITYVRLFSVVAFIILLIACVNFMNLSTARASLRMKEIGVKKTIGASQKALVTRFLSEALLIVMMSLLVALPLASFLLPHFNNFTGKQLSLLFEPKQIASIAVIVLFTALLSGSYPSFYLANLKPVTIVKGKLNTPGGSLIIRKGLVIFQFALSIIFIVGLLIVNDQVKFTQTVNLGYNRDNIISFRWKGELYNLWNGLQDGKSNEVFETFMEGMKNIPGVINATNMTGNIHDNIIGQSGVSWTGQETDRNYLFQSPIVGYDFMETLGLELKAGRSFSKDHHDDYSKIIINEAAEKLMGLTDPVGKVIQMNGESEIVGVVKDFHYGSLHNSVEPLIFRCNQTGRNILVKIKAGTEQHTIERLEKFYHQFLPSYTFDFTYMDDDYRKLYTAETNVVTLSQYFSAIAIVISCLGLFGMASFTAERRMKEIAIRKILGSSSIDIIRMLAGEFTRPVLVAIIISLPVSYLVARNWLSGFSDRIELTWWYFAAAGSLALIVSWITIGLQTVKAANVNSVECLKED
jgi:putative ABC transport system permease protein